jgi:hypothetical protein
MSIPAGEFRIYGNKVASAIADYEKAAIALYPNPASDFTLNETASKVQIFFYHGTIGKSFDTNQSAGSEFSVSDLNQGLYIVKAFDENNEMTVLKLLKN